MNILDSREEIGKIDAGNVLGSVEELGKQCQHAWEEAGKVVVPDSYRDIDNVVMCGMGGSGLGARVIDSVYSEQLRLPLIQIHEYHLPGFVNQRTLVICSSYSGETEETVANAREAINRKAKWMAIGTGNSLIEMAKQAGAPYYQIDPKYNPSNQPRMAIGYSIVGQMALAAKAGLVELSDEQISEAVAAMDRVKDESGVEIEIERNTAKQFAVKIKDRIVVFAAAEHLVGAAHTVNNQQNENAKNFCVDVQIPELNHHLMEGLKHPLSNPKNLLFVFVNSGLYPERVRRRVELTKEVVENNGIETFILETGSATKLSQAFELIQLGAFANFYLSILYGQNPAPIPWVDYFKTRLGQSLGK
ncbi:MAG: Bifunctional phosphoglucose/phosphomannose isomerase [Candidatus Woesebacteria bacterium GW2011_GWA2_44_33]|uniref:Bifunctional phosphoglucose/phosphomannose isomerase n=1 Tax=Candidatus Woesebacteria bacterium GW2011_GWA2_44_33 TaxID=1618564 RepID=A0A0G1J5S3_9BACT|nr:MAG: Bifunctional phosphoglucose/phosphomannose isomerase [Candidatus Woesebacteria bacterium GW2011_GWA2_44_33]